MDPRNTVLRVEHLKLTCHVRTIIEPIKHKL